MAGTRRTVHVVDRRPLFAETLAASLVRAGLAATAGGVDTVGLSTRIVLVDADRGLDEVTHDVVEARRRAPQADIVLVGRDGTARRGLVRRLGGDAWLSRSATVKELAHALSRGGAIKLRQTGPDTPPTGVSALTERELDVLRAMSFGATTGEAAARLGISPHTVRTHLQNIHSKLGVRSRLGAVTIARSAGLLPRIPLQAVG